VLGLPNAVAWLGWVGGVLSLVVFYAVTLWACLMVSK
jgi:amino acid permease